MARQTRSTVVFSRWNACQTKAMPLQNRVLPTGQIVAIPARGTLTGNRGIIHRDDRTLGASRWSHHAWICCMLDWQGRKRPVMTGRKWTELFFLDEAVAMAAGHRPCGYCRRADYARFVDAWAEAHGTRAKASQIDHILHRARIVKGTRLQHRHQANVDALPNGAMILQNAAAYLVWDDRLYPYQPDGYRKPIPRPKQQSVDVLTPMPMIAILHSGYRPQVHATAGL